MAGKKGTGLLLSLVLLIGLSLSGCGGNNSNNEPAPAGTQADSTAAPAASDQAVATEKTNKLEQVELSLYLPGGPDKDVASVEQAINEYLKDKINATIKINQLSWDKPADKVNLMIQSGEVFDMVYTWNFMTNAAKGAYLPLEELLDTYAKETKAQINPAYLQAATVNGHLYAIPTEKELGQSVGFAFDKAIVDKYGFDVNSIKKLEDIEPMLKTIKEKEPAITPLFMNHTDSLNWFTVYPDSEDLDGSNEIPTLLDYKTMKVFNEYDTPEILARLQLIREWYKAGYINKNGATDKTELKDAVKSGKAWFTYGNMNPTSTNDWTRLAEKPMVIKTLLPVQVSTKSLQGSMLAISRTSKNPERAMMFMNLIHTDPVLYNLLTFGIEGKHYKKVSDNTVEFIPDSGYNSVSSWMIGNVLLNYLNKDEDPKRVQLYTDWNKNSKVSPVIGFVFDSTKVQSQIGALINITKQYKNTLYSGEKDPEPILKEMNNKLKAAGLDAVISEIQSQMDAFLAAK
ncbi:ABC transporter substrate-binding protein [Paenibacillus jilunlii]|uniref:Putative aldouronate transport system substrate-binding protein n=1 Tax=Paenibacillus jilunlii TaxID=682956 RepID=A0A1G9J2G2_9BACL|nr:ABC transporter substrate-binding protein [Paenibacillus jilunlii]SDL31364.1 putative aldouronate transport system substrate-binding protein [Paenibacillus jilunlii]